MQVAVGKDVEAVCRKCGEVWHVIVSVDAGGKITKVQCKQCSAYHRYKPPEGEERVDAAPKARKASGGTAASRPKTSRPKAARKSGSTEEPIVSPDMSRPVRLYKISESYSPGDRVDHPKFGQGVVEALPGPGKMNVFFEDGRRTLACGR